MSVLTAQLEQLPANARRIKTDEFTEVVNELRDVFDRHSFRLRPSVGSISLVSCSSLTPQLGFSNMTTGQALRRQLAALRGGTVPFEAPARPTPEKSVQSRLIYEAMHNDGRLRSIKRALDDDHSHWFVTDEISLNASDETSPNDKAKRVVADLLVVRVNRSGESEIVNVELKSERTTRTHGQIETFWTFMGPSQVAIWHEFVDFIIGGNNRRWKARDGNKGIVIWPGLKDGSKMLDRTAQLMASYKSDGIDTICYFGPNYLFEPERSA